MCEDNCTAIDVEVTQRLVNFLTRFPDEDLVRRSLTHFHTPRSALDRDGLEVMHHANSVRNAAVALLEDPKELDDNGKFLSLYEEDVKARAAYDERVSSIHKRINVFEDLLNAIAFELRGICSYTGEAPSTDLEARKILLTARIETAENLWLTCPDTQETRDMHDVLLSIKGELPGLSTHEACTSLGDFVDSRVPQLPLVRRWWSYGV